MLLHRASFFYMYFTEYFKASYAYSLLTFFGVRKSSGTIPSRHPTEIPNDEPENLAAANNTQILCGHASENGQQLQISCMESQAHVRR